MRATVEAGKGQPPVRPETAAAKEGNAAGGPAAILAVSDEVDERLLAESLPDALTGIRLVLSCGDLPGDYLEALTNRFRVPLLYVRGNHDGGRRDAPPPGENIHGRVVNVRGLRIVGFEGSRWYNGEGVQYTEWQMWWMVQAIRPAVWRARGVDIVVTHAPPYGIHDMSDVCHTGFKAFRALVGTLRPRYFIHGHTHLNYSSGASRRTEVGQTRVMNAFRSLVIPVHTPLRAVR